MNNHKGLAPIAIILIIIGVLILGGGSYYAVKKFQKQTEVSNQTKSPPSQPTQQQNQITPTIDETANWKTYRNKKYGFEFRYPRDWLIVTKKNDLPEIWDPEAYDKVKNYFGEGVPDVDISIVQNLSKKDFLDWYKEYDPTNFQQYPPVSFIVDCRRWH